MNGTKNKSRPSIVYLAGPMIGISEHNYPAFSKAAEGLREEGYAVINPTEIFGGDTTLPLDYYQKAQTLLLTMVDVIMLLPGWRGSKGCLQEVSIALALDLPIYYAPTGGLVVTSPLDINKMLVSFLEEEGEKS